MDSLNKNWLAILLIAVIFGTLGFLLGRVTGHSHHKAGGKHKKERMIIRKESADTDSLNIEVEVSADGDMETTINTDTVMKDGKQIIIKEVKKVRK